MKKVDEALLNEEMPLETLLLQYKHDKYKLGYAAVRWAKEIKIKENLPDSLQTLIPRAMKEILAGKVTLKDVEKLPVIVKVTPPPPLSTQASTPTITFAADPEEKPELTAEEKE